MQLHEKDMQDCANKEKEIKGKDNKENTLLNKDVEKAETAKRFTPPSIEEVQSYISEKGYSGDILSPATVIAKSAPFIGDITCSQSLSFTDTTKSFNDPPCAEIGSKGT